MDKKSKFILSAEEAFAGRVALGVMVTRPVNVWLQMIPGMFILDFLKRSIETRKTIRYFMPPRYLAMEGALTLARGDHPDKSPDPLEEKTRALLESMHLYSGPAHKTMIDLLHLLSNHYVKLLKAPGDNYNELVRAVYGNRQGYKDFLTHLTSGEEVFDQALSQDRGDAEGLRPVMDERRKSAEKQRDNDLDTFFYG